jgi:hypothetical protein
MPNRLTAMPSSTNVRRPVTEEAKVRLSKLMINPRKVTIIPIGITLQFSPLSIFSSGLHFTRMAMETATRSTAAA